MTKTSAINRIHELLDDNSFVEVGAYITARSTDYNMQSQETPADGVVTGKKVGTTTIYGKGAEHTYRCDLTVNKKIKNMLTR